MAKKEIVLDRCPDGRPLTVQIVEVEEVKEAPKKKVVKKKPAKKVTK